MARSVDGVFVAQLEPVSELRAQPRRQVRIDLDGHDAVGQFQQLRGQHALARTDLDEDIVRCGLDGRDNFFDRAAVAQEVLAPLFLRACHLSRRID